jgi:hypothetical protein
MPSGASCELPWPKRPRSCSTKRAARRVKLFRTAGIGMFVILILRASFTSRSLLKLSSGKKNQEITIRSITVDGPASECPGVNKSAGSMKPVHKNDNKYASACIWSHKSGSRSKATHSPPLD